MLVGTLLQHMSRRYPDRPAIISRSETVRYSELYRRAVALANTLLNRGYRRGDHIGVLTRKTPETIIAYLGMGLAGIVGVPINFHHRGERIARIAASIDMKLLFVDGFFQPLLRESQAAGLDVPLVIVGEEQSSLDHWDSFQRDSGESAPEIELSEDDVFYLNFTSGSTGQPKAVGTTHAHIHWNTISSLEIMGIGEGERHLCMFAVFSHPHELFARPLWTGGTIVLLDSLYPKAIAATISEHGVNHIMGLAPMYEMLLPFAGSDRYNFSTVRLAESGGMVTTLRLQEQFRGAFNLAIRPVWGSTETTGIALAVSEKVGVTSSCGRPAPYYNVKIIDPKGNEVSPGETGAMIIQGPAVVSGYIDDAAETASCFIDGWFHSGDMVYTDDEGLFHFRGRESGMMKVGGLKVFPREIEDIIRTMPEIEDVVVVPEYEKLRGEVPRALIVLREGETTDDQAVRDFCREHLPNYMIPRSIDFTASFPTTPSGKIDRVAIMEAMASGDQLSEVDSLRHRLEKIDVRLLNLLNERARVSLQLRGLQQSAGQSLFRPGEDEDTIKRILGFNSGPLYDEFVERLFRELLDYLTMMQG